jgi:hypothetical protein
LGCNYFLLDGQPQVVFISLYQALFIYGKLTIAFLFEQVGYKINKSHFSLSELWEMIYRP